jgi:hypothetical protein
MRRDFGDITGGTQMPIRRYLGEGGVFSPKTISEMSRALEEACERLGISGEKQRQAVAKFIIRLAGEDNSLDATALRDRAVVALGGVAYSATIPASPQTSPHAAAE